MWKGEGLQKIYFSSNESAESAALLRTWTVINISYSSLIYFS